MTQQDKDREAFEKWGSTVGYPANRISKWPHPSKPEEYQHTDTQEKWGAWQAALAYERANNAPKLTERETLDRVEMAIATARGKDIRLPSHVVSSEELAKVALRATGIRFKEEAI